MHKTEAGERRKGLKRTALELEKEVKALGKVGLMKPAARTRQDEANRLKAEAEALKDKVRLEDLHVLGDGEAHQEGLQNLYLLDGFLEGGRRGTECPSWLLQKARC